mmetsp:Transcript_77529/g.217372  ORF Transcript_77529/g.217372 Transcript_77529/m.217372 type:complete len:304 (+) Transcript_77529:69-980(+)
MSRIMPPLLDGKNISCSKTAKSHHLSSDAATRLVLGQTALNFNEIVGRVDIGFVIDAVRSIFITREVVDGVGCRSNPGNLSFNAQQVLAHLQTHVTHLAPVLSPAVAYNPILGSSGWIGAPTYNGHNVVGRFRVIVGGEDTSRVLHNRFGIDGCRHRATGVNLCHDFVASSFLVLFVVVNKTVLGHGRIWKVINLAALSTHSTKGVTSLAGVCGVARSIHMSAESLLGIIAASHVRLAGVIRNISSLFNELIGRGVVSSIAGSRHFGSAVQDELNRKIDVISLALSGDFDAIPETTKGTVSPA